MPRWTERCANLRKFLCAKDPRRQSVFAICPSCCNCCQVCDSPHRFKLSCNSSQWLSGTSNRWGRGRLLLYCMTQLWFIAMTAIWIGRGRDLTPPPVCCCAPKPTPEASVSSCDQIRSSWSDHNKVSISNQGINVILDHDLRFSGCTSTSRKWIN